MIFLPGHRKLKFQFKEQHVKDGLSLADALAGKAGTVYLGSGNVELWTPSSGRLTRPEAVCDCRFLPLQPALIEHFKEETAHLLLPANFILFQGHRKEHIAQALSMFDYVITPRHRIRNTPRDFNETHILAYEKPLYTRNRYDINKAYN